MTAVYCSDRLYCASPPPPASVEMPPAESVSVTPILGVLIGVVASLIIIAIGVVACMRNNR